MTTKRTVLKPLETESIFYRRGFKLGQSDAAGGTPFSRWVKQHGEYVRVDWEGKCGRPSDLNDSERAAARGYVDACCA